MSGRNAIAIAVAAVIVVGGAFLIGKYYNANTSTTIAGTTLTVDDLPGLIDGRVKPIVDKIVAPIKTDVATIKRELAETTTRIDTALEKQNGVLTNIEKLIKERPTTTPTPATTTPAAPAVSPKEQQRWATIRMECLPEDQKNLDLGDSLSDEAFNAQVAHCKANKLAKQQVVSPPPAAGPQQVVQNGPAGDPDAVDGPDGQLDESGQPRAQMAYYNQGGRRCAAGTRPAGSFGCVGRTITNRAEIQVFDQRIPSGCVPGQVREVWKDGVDPQGRRVRYKITQHTECGPRRGY